MSAQPLIILILIVFDTALPYKRLLFKMLFPVQMYVHSY